MAVKTFAEAIDLSSPNASLSNVGVVHCQWAGCFEYPAYMVGQWDTVTQEECGEIQFMCFAHALKVQEMANEIEG